jgi:hypothetical protein
MKYQIILDGVLDAELTRLFGAAREITGHGANLLAQGGDTSSGGTTSTGGSTSNCGGVGNPCPNGVSPHDPYLVILGSGAAIGLVVGLVVGVLVGKAQSGTSK